MNLFIDTNIFLSFYHYTSDDLEELRKLNLLVLQSRLHLFVPQQVEMEFTRNRENRIADALKRLKEQRLSLQFPQVCKEYVAYSELRKLQREYEQKHNELLEILTRDVEDKTLKADQIIKDLFSSGEKLESTPAVVDRARLRMAIGSPPGKQGSLGDAINWEVLLGVCREGEALYFVTDDKDYRSPLDENRFDAFLLDEWAKKKSSNLFFYNRLSAFFKEQFPDIKLAGEYEKEALIIELGNSTNFARTHELVARLNRYADYTEAQLNQIVESSMTNNQVAWIIGDEDVKEFLTKILTGNEDKIDVDRAKRLRQFLKADSASDKATSFEDLFDDPPF